MVLCVSSPRAGEPWNSLASHSTQTTELQVQQENLPLKRCRSYWERHLISISAVHTQEGIHTNICTQNRQTDSRTGRLLVTEPLFLQFRNFEAGGRDDWFCTSLIYMCIANSLRHMSKHHFWWFTDIKPVKKLFSLQMPGSTVRIWHRRIHWVLLLILWSMATS